MLLSAACVGACGGGGGGGAGTVVTPTPSPSSPTPSAPTYPKFADLTGDQAHLSTCTAITIASPPNVYPVSGPDGGLYLTYTAATQNWMVSGDGAVLTFTPAERDTAAPASLMSYVKPGPPIQRFSIGATGAGSAPAEYFRAVSLNAVTPFGPRIYSCVLGVKTLVTDRPPGSTFNFPNARAGGYLFRVLPFTSGNFTQYATGSTVTTFDVNLTTGKVTAVVRLVATPLPIGSGSDIDFGTVTATADIDATTGGYSGTTITSPDFTNIALGQLSGRFFGPQGKEAGFVMSMVAEKADGSRYYLSFGGAAIR